MSITVNGKTYSLSHLQPFEVIYKDGKGVGNNIVVRVEFTTHVYSKRRAIATDPHDLLDENGTARLFCIDRYNLSLDLGDVCTRMIQDNFFTWVSKDYNGISNLTVMDGRISDGDQDLIFYYLYPSSRNGVDIELIVKSAYRKNVITKLIKRKYNIKQKIKECYFNQKKVP